MSWIYEALKRLFDATINVFINMPIALLGKVEQPTYNGPVFNGPVYINPIIVTDKESAVELARKIQPTAITSDEPETKTPETTD